MIIWAQWLSDKKKCKGPELYKYKVQTHWKYLWNANIWGLITGHESIILIASKSYTADK